MEDNYVSMQEREIVKLEVYEEFEKKSAKENEELDPQEIEYKRNLHVKEYFPEALRKYMKSKK